MVWALSFLAAGQAPMYTAIVVKKYLRPSHRGAAQNMKDKLDSALLEAYELIESNRANEAREMLRPLLDEFPDETDLWWVYAHAVENPKEAEEALERVIALDPGLTDASQLLDDLRADEATAQPGVRPIQPLTPIPSADARDKNEFRDDFEEDEDYLPDSDTGTNWLLLGGIALLLLLAAVVIIALSISGATRTDTTPSAVAAISTESLVTEDSSDITPTESVAEAQSGGTATSEINDSAAQSTENATDASLDETNEASLSTDETVETTVENTPTQETSAATIDDNSDTQETEASETPDLDETTSLAATDVADDSTEEVNATADIEDSPEETDEPESTVTTEATAVSTDADETEEADDEASTEEVEVTDITTPTATEVQPTRTRIPTRTPSPTDAPTPTPTVTPDPIMLLTSSMEEMGNFDLSGNDPIVETTVFGDTLIFEVCLEDNNRSTLLQESLTTLATSSVETLDVDAIAVAIYNCELDETIRVIGISLEDAISFRDDELSSEEFQLSWQVIG
jgi:tetratricopeptide (TPR) repeat protein